MSARRRLGAAETLVAAQIAVSLVLLVGTSLFARSLLNLERHPLDSIRSTFARPHQPAARRIQSDEAPGSSTENFTTV